MATEYGELCIDRAGLVRLLTVPGPSNEGIKDRLIDWAGRARSFEILSSMSRSPLRQIGIGDHAADDVVAWLKDFEEGVIARIGVSDDELDSSGRVRK
jgi:hypothetical protein